VPIEAICQERQPAELSAETLLKRIDLPLEWPLQLKTVGPAQSLADSYRGDESANVARIVKRTVFSVPGDKSAKFTESAEAPVLFGQPSSAQRPRPARNFNCLDSR
jgi:hypothetical protein